MNRPLVTVICKSYNQQPLIRQAVQSVLDQRYPNVELIIIDAGSNDGSQDLIDQLIASHPGIKYLPQDKKINEGKALQLGLKHSKGDYIIEINGDNQLQVNRIEEGVNGFEKRGSSYAINFCDAELINEKGESSGTFYSNTKDFDENIIYNLLNNKFICPPTLMLRKNLVDEFYEEKYLGFTDPLFLLKASEKFKSFYINEPLVKYRNIHRKEQGTDDYYSTLCRTRKFFNNKNERKAWKRHIKGAIIGALKSADIKLAFKLTELYLRK